MPSIRRIALLALGLLVVAGCAPSAPPVVDTTADEAALRSDSKAWADAYNAGDPDKIVALYTDDAVLMPPDAPAATGREAMRAFLTADIANSKAAGITLAIADGTAGVSGNLGWHSGTFKVTNAAGDTLGTGKYLDISRKADGKWLVFRDTWNNDAPAPPPAPPAPPAAPAKAKK